jgi:hypothetical protein
VHLISYSYRICGGFLGSSISCEPPLQRFCHLACSKPLAGILLMRKVSPVREAPAHAESLPNFAEFPRSRLREPVRERNPVKNAEFRRAGAEFRHICGVTSLIVYVKRGWDASNKRNAIPQSIKFCQRMEALRIHRAYLDEYYGVQEREVPAPTTAVLVDEDDDEDYIVGDGRNGESGNRDKDDEDEQLDIEDDEDEDEPEGIVGRTSDIASAVEYPQPALALAIRPTRRASWQELINRHGAMDLKHVLTSFLGPRARGENLFLISSDRLDVWHKLSLYHLPLSFAPDEPSHCDVIRARPSELDSHGRVRHEGTFDTALFLKDSHGFGIHSKCLPPPPNFSTVCVFNSHQLLQDTTPVAYVPFSDFPNDSSISTLANLPTSSFLHHSIVPSRPFTSCTLRPTIVSATSVNVSLCPSLTLPSAATSHPVFAAFELTSTSHSTRISTYSMRDAASFLTTTTTAIHFRYSTTGVTCVPCLSRTTGSVVQAEPAPGKFPFA